MADTFTPNYNLTKPQVGGDPDTWGDLLNANFDILDANLFAAQTTATAAFPAAGGTMLGNLTIAPAVGQAAVVLNKPASGQSAILYGSTAGSSRWAAQFGTAAAESGGNVGSDFSLTRYDNAGAPAGTPLVIARSTGVATFEQRPVFATNTPWDSGNLTPSAYALRSGAAFTGAVSVGGGALTVSTTGVLPNLSIFDSTQGGQLRIQAANTGGKTFRVNASTSLEIVNNAYTTVISSLTDAGVWSAADFSATSDPRLKDEIRPLLRGLEELKRMAPREYVKYDNEEFLGEGKSEIGFMADEVAEVAPEAISEHCGYKHVSYGQLTALLASAILELDRRLTLAGV